MQVQRMSRLPRPSGEDVHPCSASRVLFVDILVVDRLRLTLNTYFILRVF
jgi:hypothetical protein